MLWRVVSITLDAVGPMPPGTESSSFRFEARTIMFREPKRAGREDKRVQSHPITSRIQVGLGKSGPHPYSGSVVSANSGNRAGPEAGQTQSATPLVGKRS